VRLVTARRSPAPDLESPRVLAALEARGAAAEFVAWDDPAVEWGAARANVIRSTWDYPGRLAAFLAWADRAGAAAPLWNSARAVRWNAHKRYVLALEARGVPVVPTECVCRDAARGLGRVLADRGWREAVIKPAVGLGAAGAARVRADDAGEARLADLLARGDALVQPFVESLASEGERSLVFFGGRFRHAVRKDPAPGDFRVQEHVGGRTRASPAHADEIAAAEAALASVDEALLFARVDLVRIDGRPRLSELELIEPSLYLEHVAGGYDAFAETLAAWALGASSTSSSTDASPGTPTRSGKP
jgi:glutathione synthase/RimK-type ligase-like ATP-grasp enzyme